MAPNSFGLDIAREDMNALLVGPRCIFVARLRDDTSCPLHGHVFQDMYTPCSRSQLDGALFVVDRHNMARVHHQQASPGGFEGDPAHLAPRAIMYLMYSASVMPSYDMLNGFFGAELGLLASGDTGFGRFARVVGCGGDRFTDGTLNSSAWRTDPSERAADHDATSLRN